MSPREERRLRRQDISRAQLLDAAEEVFGRKGYHDTTLKEVAELAEFSVGSVYSFFAGKDDLFRNIFLRRGGEFMAGMRAVVDGTGSPTERLRDLLDFQVGFFREHPNFAQLTLRHSNTALLDLAGDIDRTLVANRAEAMELQRSLFDAGQRVGVFRAGDPGVLSEIFSGMVFAYQACDPAIAGGNGSERLPLEAFHELVQAAFAAR